MKHDRDSAQQRLSGHHRPGWGPWIRARRPKECTTLSYRYWGTTTNALRAYVQQCSCFLKILQSWDARPSYPSIRVRMRATLLKCQQIGTLNCNTAGSQRSKRPVADVASADPAQGTRAGRACHRPHRILPPPRPHRCRGGRDVSSSVSCHSIQFSSHPIQSEDRKIAAEEEDGYSCAKIASDGHHVKASLLLSGLQLQGLMCWK